MIFALSGLVLRVSKKIFPEDEEEPVSSLSCSNVSLRARDRRAEDDEVLRSVALALEANIQEASPLSQYSANFKASFWRSLARNYPGIISFAANRLDLHERKIVFAVLVKLERFLERSAPHERALDYAVDEHARSALLYSLMSAQTHRDAEMISAILRSTLDTIVAQESLSVVQRAILPAAIVDYYDTFSRGRNAATDDFFADTEFALSPYKKGDPPTPGPLFLLNCCCPAALLAPFARFFSGGRQSSLLQRSSSSSEQGPCLRSSSSLSVVSPGGSSSTKKTRQAPRRLSYRYVRKRSQKNVEDECSTGHAVEKQQDRVERKALSYLDHHERKLAREPAVRLPSAHALPSPRDDDDDQGSNDENASSSDNDEADPPGSLSPKKTSSTTFYVVHHDLDSPPSSDANPFSY